MPVFLLNIRINEFGGNYNRFNKDIFNNSGNVIKITLLIIQFTINNFVQKGSEDTFWLSIRMLYILSCLDKMCEKNFSAELDASLSLSTNMIMK